MSRIAPTFANLAKQNKKALIPFITAGDPHPSLTTALMHKLVESGANIIELGVPFSDPMADGPVIQRASERALKLGINLKQTLALVAEFRKKDSTTPIVLMGYANPIEAMGIKQFVKNAQSSGVDGVLVVDYPPEESADLVNLLAQHDIDLIFLIAPTSSKMRIAQIAKLASGYVYYVSLKGVTGAKHLDLDEIKTKIPQLQSQINIPIGIGFGISNSEMAKQAAKLADAVIIGSRIIQEIESASQDKVLEKAGTFLSEIRVALDKATLKDK